VFQHNGAPGAVDQVINGTCVDQVGSVRYCTDSGRLQWSPTAAVMHGGRPDAVPSLESVVELAHPDDRATVVDSLQRLIDGKPVKSHYRLLNPAGEARWVVMVSDPLAYTAGQDGESSGLVIDVTDTVQSGLTAAVSEVFESRATIEQAKGVLMAAHGMTADQAFGALARRSQETNIKLRDLSRRFLTTVSGRFSNLSRSHVDRGLLTAGLQLAAGNDEAAIPPAAV
jgi:hypothetical protein